MSLTTAERTQLLGRIATDRQFRTLVLSSPRKAAGELGIALSESEEDQILSGMREIRKIVERKDRLLSSSQMAPFLFSVLLTHDDGDEEDEDAPIGPELGSRNRPPEQIPEVQ
jgi:hypothetical protein